MRPTLKRLSVLCACTLLFACADISMRSGAPVATHHYGSADETYLLGRGAHLRGRTDEALAAYHATLQADPGHVNGRNGLATLHAERGELAKAIPLWQALTVAAPDGPQSAFLFSNLGYAELLNGDYAAAVATLEKACMLDPLSERAWHHLGSALDKLGQHQRAQRMYAQASALAAHNFRVDYSVAQRSGVAAIDSAVAAEHAADGYPASELHQTESGIFELRRSGAASLAPALPSPAPATAPADSDPSPAPATLAGALAAGREPALPPSRSPDNTNLEIRNGNGVTGMARRLARKLGDAGVRVTRLSNQKGFNVAHTRIEYQPGFRDAAVRLAERFGDAALVEVERSETADVRLVLGRDMMRSKMEARRLIRAALARAAAKNAI
jgi:tetratricopeptide (TPR) repeat protein